MGVAEFGAMNGKEQEKEMSEKSKHVAETFRSYSNSCNKKTKNLEKDSTKVMRYP